MLASVTCALLQVLHMKGFHRKWSLLIIASLWILGTINTFLLPSYKVGEEKRTKDKKPKVTEKEARENGKLVNLSQDRKARATHGALTVRLFDELYSATEIFFLV